MTLNPVDVPEMLRRNKDQMFLIESEAIEFIRDTYIAYGGVNRAYDSVKANQDVDYEALAERTEKRTKTKMAVVKQDCDSFDIVPLDVAREEGLVAAKHFWNINWIERHIRINSLLKNNSRCIVDVCALGFKHQFAPVEILFIDCPHQRLITVGIVPAKMVKSEKIKFFKPNGTWRNAQSLFCNFGRKKNATRFDVPLNFEH